VHPDEDERTFQAPGRSRYTKRRYVSHLAALTVSISCHSGPATVLALGGSRGHQALSDSRSADPGVDCKYASDSRSFADSLLMNVANISHLL